MSNRSFNLGSCITYPAEGSNSDALRFGCFTTTVHTCNQLNDAFLLNDMGFEARFDSNRVCDREKQSQDSSGVLNPNHRVLQEYSNDDHMNQRFGGNRSRANYVQNECPDGTVSLETCCYGDCNRPLGLCIRNEDIDENTLCDNAYKSAFRPDGRFRSSGNTVLKSQGKSTSRRISQYLVPETKSVLSGIGCAGGNCIRIPDLYKHLQKNKVIDFDFYPYDAKSFNKLYSGIVPLPADQTPREHFIQMYTEGGHGINRPMNIDEIFDAHSNEENINLTRNDIVLMVSSYEVEKTFQSKDNDCICDVANVIDTEEITIHFSSVKSPIDDSSFKLKVPVGTGDFVTRKIGGTRVSKDALSKILNNDLDTVLNRVVSSREIQNSSEMVGLCTLPNGTNINADQEICDSLRGRFTLDITLDPTFTRQYKSTKVLQRAIRYEYFDSTNVNDPQVLERLNQSSSYLPPEIPEEVDWPQIDPNGPQGGRNLINTCCTGDCFECLLAAMREVESGIHTQSGQDTTVVTHVEPGSLPNPCDCPDDFFDDNNDFTNPACCACNVASHIDCVDTPREQRNPYTCWSCGGLQQKNDYWRTAALACTIMPACCIFNDLNWMEELCKPCKKPDFLPCRGPCLRCYNNPDNPDPFADENCEIIDDGEPLFPEDPTNLGNRRGPFLSCEECEKQGGKCDCYTQKEVDDSVKACCQRKRDLSLLAIRCWLRRFTRNGGCQRGTGNGFKDGLSPDCRYINPDASCWSCLDIAAAYNGGVCGHINQQSTVPNHLRKIKDVLCDIGGGCENCIELEVTNCDPLYVDPCNPQQPLPTQPEIDPLDPDPYPWPEIQCDPDQPPVPWPDEFKEPRQFPPTITPHGDDDHCPDDDPPIDDEVRADFSDSWENLPNARVPQGGRQGESGVFLPDFVPGIGPYAVYGTGKSGTGFYYPMYLTARGAYAANLSGFDRVEIKTGQKDGLLYHTHRLREYPDIVFYMPDDQMNHGVEDSGGFRLFRGGGSGSRVNQSRSSGSSTPPPSSPPPSSPPPTPPSSGGGY